jgi:uncharacterized protein related to proFAR isomerase
MRKKSGRKPRYDSLRHYPSSRYVMVFSALTCFSVSTVLKQFRRTIHLRQQAVTSEALDRTKKVKINRREIVSVDLKSQNILSSSS